MNKTIKDIEIISAPSILGLKPSGVEILSLNLLASGLAEKFHTSPPVVHVPTLNDLYSEKRDQRSLKIFLYH
jgi:arginase